MTPEPARERSVTFPSSELCVHITGSGAGRGDVDEGLAGAVGWW